MVSKESAINSKKKDYHIPYDNIDKFFNLNLNQSQKCSMTKTKSLTFQNTNNHGYTVADLCQGKGKSWNKSTKEFCFKTSKNQALNIVDSDDEEDAKRWKKHDKNNKVNSSTLSLHIVAWENSNDGEGVKDLAYREEVQSAVKPPEVEVPRQMDGNEPPSAPEVQQFTASQKLVSPNQDPPPQSLETQILQTAAPVVEQKKQVKRAQLSRSSSLPVKKRAKRHAVPERIYNLRKPKKNDDAATKPLVNYRRFTSTDIHNIFTQATKKPSFLYCTDEEEISIKNISTIMVLLQHRERMLLGAFDVDNRLAFRFGDQRGSRCNKFLDFTRSIGKKINAPFKVERKVVCNAMVGFDDVPLEASDVAILLIGFQMIECGGLSFLNKWMIPVDNLIQERLHFHNLLNARNRTSSARMDSESDDIYPSGNERPLTTPSMNQQTQSSSLDPSHNGAGSTLVLPASNFNTATKENNHEVARMDSESDDIYPSGNERPLTTPSMNQQTQSSSLDPSHNGAGSTLVLPASNFNTATKENNHEVARMDSESIYPNGIQRPLALPSSFAPSHKGAGSTLVLPASNFNTATKENNHEVVKLDELSFMLDKSHISERGGRVESPSMANKDPSSEMSRGGGNNPPLKEQQKIRIELHPAARTQSLQTSRSSINGTYPTSSRDPQSTSPTTEDAILKKKKDDSNVKRSQALLKESDEFMEHIQKKHNLDTTQPADILGPKISRKKHNWDAAQTIEDLLDFGPSKNRRHSDSFGHIDDIFLQSTRPRLIQNPVKRREMPKTPQMESDFIKFRFAGSMTTPGQTPRPRKAVQKLPTLQFGHESGIASTFGGDVASVIGREVRKEVSKPVPRKANIIDDPMSVLREMYQDPGPIDAKCNQKADNMQEQWRIGDDCSEAESCSAASGNEEVSSSETTPTKQSIQRSNEKQDGSDNIVEAPASRKTKRTSTSNRSTSVPKNIPELPDDFEMLLENVNFQTKGRKQCGETFGEMSIKGYDLYSLRARQYVNDLIIDKYMELVCSKSTESGNNYRKSFAFGTFFYTMLNNGQDPNKLVSWIKEDLFDYELLFFPINQENHWYLFVADTVNRNHFVYDSLYYGGNDTEIDQIVDFLKFYAKKKNHDIDWNDWSKNPVEEQIGPKQTNGVDCGIFLCQYAEHLSRRANLDFTQSGMVNYRKIMLYELIKGQLTPRLNKEEKAIEQNDA